MCKVLIPGRPDQTRNYEAALRSVEIRSTVSTGYPCDPGQYDGLLLPGGGDIDPILFRQANLGSRNIDLDLDLRQLSLLDQFVNAGKPVLGICKGMQIINVYFGGDIIQHLPTAFFHAWKQKDQLHPVQTMPDTILAQLYGASGIVNSAHHQGIGTTGKGLRVIQTAPDKTAEALIHETLPILALQWHPERLFEEKLPNALSGRMLLLYFRSLLEKGKL